MKLISGGMIVNSNCIVTNLNKSILNITQKQLNPFKFFSKTCYIDKNNRTANFVGYSKLKELDINDFFKRKHMDEDMEAELTEMDSRPDNLVASEDASVDESIPIDLRKE